ncbi:hypothetical protein [Arthrobacter psychrolactophilus]
MSGFAGYWYWYWYVFRLVRAPGFSVGSPLVALGAGADSSGGVNASFVAALVDGVVTAWVSDAELVAERPMIQIVTTTATKNKPISIRVKYFLYLEVPAVST